MSCWPLSWDLRYCTSPTMHSSRQSAAIAASSDRLTCSCEICANTLLPRAAATAAAAAAATSHASLWMSCEQVMARCTSRASCAALSLARALSASEIVTGMLTVMLRSWSMSPVASAAVSAGLDSGMLAITSTCVRVPGGIACSSVSLHAYSVSIPCSRRLRLGPNIPMRNCTPALTVEQRKVNNDDTNE